MQRAKKVLLIFSFTAIAAILSFGIFTHLSTEKEIDQKQDLLLQALHNTKGEYDERIIVLNKTTHSQAKEFAEKTGAELRINKQGNYATLTLPESSDIVEVLSSDDVRNYIDSIGLDYYVSVSSLTQTSDDGISGEYEYVSQNVNYTVNDPLFSSQEYLPHINVGNAWNTTRGDGVTVAVIDTGIDYDHDEFKGRISEYSYNATYDKIVKDHGFSVIDDVHGHGTAVSGVISSALNNSVGISGIASDAELLVIKCEVNDDGEYNGSDLMFGIYYAIERDVDVINMSFGGPTNSYADAVKLAYDSDIVCVASAGNDATSALNYPAANEYVIGVGAGIYYDDASFALTDYSNYGDNTDVVAMGTCYTTFKDNKYGYEKGTSLACPQVTAAVALYLSNNQYATVDSVKEILYASTVDTGEPGEDFYFGYGLLDINALVCEKKGTVTYNMLTDELENTTGRFVRNHALQNIPEPERRYAVFDGWYYDIYCTEPLDLYRDKWNADITLYAGWANEDDGIPYSYVILDDNTVEINSYTGKRRYITVPDIIDGMTVSSIGEKAFAGNQKLCGVTLPHTLTEISTQAFSGCNNLRSIEIPDNVTYIGEEAFKDTPRLKTIDISDNSKLAVIEKFAFHSSAIEKFYIPSELQVLDGSAFYNCSSLYKFDISPNSKNFKIYDDILYSYTLSTVVAFPTGKTDITEVKLPDNTMSVGKYAFANAPVEYIDLNNVMQIYDRAFDKARIRELYMPDSVKHLGKAVFNECTLLKKATISNGLTEILEGAFFGCNKLSEIIIPQNIVKIEKNAFRSTGIQTLVFAESSRLAYIGNSAFAASNISQLTIPKSVMQIMDNAFASCMNLENVSFEEGINLKTLNVGIFKGDILLRSFTIPNCVETIKANVFANSGLEAITIHKNITSIDYGVFTGCNALTAISVDEENNHYTSVDGVLYSWDKTKLVSYAPGKSETTYATLSTTLEIERQAFANVRHLTGITLNQGLTFIGVEAFMDTNLNSVSIPSSVEQISRYAFRNNSKLSNISIPNNSNLKRLGFGAFAGTTIHSFKIPAKVSSLGQGVFSGCENLTSVTFLQNSLIETLPAFTFDGAENLTAIKFENGSSLKSVQAKALYGLSNLQTLDFGDARVENIDNYAFMFCEKLISIKIPSGTTNIGRFAFFGCKKLTEILLPASVEHIGENAFSANSVMNIYFESETLPLHLDEGWDNDIRGYYVGVTDVIEKGSWKYAVTASGGISIIGYLGSEKDINLNEENFGGNIISIGGYAFADSEICSIVLPESLKHIYAYAFYSTDISNISIPQNVEFIGKNAFDSSTLESVEFAENSVLKTVESYAFANCYKLSSFRFPQSVQFLGTGVLAESSVANLDISTLKVSEIPQNAFMGTKITSIKIPDSVVLINHNAFRNCKNLQSVSWGNGEDVYLMSNAFYNTGLTELNIPENITYIGEYCFTGLTSLEEITVSENNPKYSSTDGLLYSKDGRKLIAAPAGRSGTITLPISVENLGFGAFENSKLTRIEFSPGSNILTFGYRCFYNSEITEFTVPKSVVSFDYYAFAMCNNLTQVTFADNSSMRGIYEGAFFGCSKLQKIELPEEVVEISDYAFYGCSKLSKLPISENSQVLGIYDYAFANCKLKEIVIPETVVEIGEYAFMGNDMIAVTVPDANYKELSLGLGSFAECDNLAYLSVPFIGASYEDDSITWVSYIFGAGAYTAGKDYIPQSLKNINITRNATFVGTGAFYDFQHLESITLPETIEKVYFRAFYKCSGKYEFFKPIYFMNRNVNKDYIVSSLFSDSHLSSGFSGDLVIAEGPTQIEGRFLTNLVNVDSITIPKSVTNLADNAFVSYNSGVSESQHIDIYYQGDLNDWCNIKNQGCIAENYDLYLNGELVTDVTLPLTSSGALTSGFGGCQSIKRVIIPEGITNISCKAFKNCKNIDYVYIPSTCKTVPSGMFESSGIKNIELAEGVETIEDGALLYVYDGLESIVIPKTLKSLPFMYSAENVYVPDIETFFNLEKATFATRNLYINGEICENITVPDGITAIREYLFEGSESIKSVKLPESVLSIEQFAFAAPSLEYINLEDSKVTAIGRGAFSSSALTVADLPDTLVTLGNFVFKDCASLRFVRLPSGLTKIDGTTFMNCSEYIVDNDSQIVINTTLDFPGAYDPSIIIKQDGTIAVYSKKTTNNELIFDDSGFVFEKIPNNDGSFRYAMLFYMGKEDEAVLPSSINGNPYDFKDTLSLHQVHALPATVTVPRELTSLDELFASSFYASSGKVGYVKKVILPEDFTSFGEYNFRSIDLESFEFNDNVTVIPAGLFNDCQNLKSVKLPKNLNEIKKSVFLGCTDIKSIEIPESVTKIGSSAFYGCTSLEEITLPSKITVVESEMFKNCASLESVTLPDSVEKIGDYAFSGCKSLKNITISKNVSSIGKEAFAGCLAINIDEENQNFVMEADVLYNKDKTSILWIAPTVTHYTVPATVTDIGTIFKGNTNIQSVEFENGVTFTSIPADAFNSCTALKRVVLPEGIKSIGDYAFSDATALEEVILPAGLEKIHYQAFSVCKSLKTIDIPDSVTYIDGFCFEFSGLEEIDLSGLNMEYLGGSDIFRYCKSLTSVKLPETLKTLGSSTFEECIALKHIDLPKTLETIGPRAFRSAGLNEIQLPETIKTIGSVAFLNCPIKEIIIPEGVTKIASQTFQWSGLESIKLPSTLRIIESQGLSSKVIKYLEIPEGVENIENGAFEDCYELSVIKVPSTLKTFPKTNAKGFDEFYYGGTPEQWIVVQNSNTSVSIRTNKIKNFYAAGKLMEEVNVPEGIEEVNVNTGLSNIACLKSVTLASTVKSLGDRAFENCTNLESITIPAGLESIDTSAFAGCNRIKEVIIDENNEHFVVVDGVVYDKALTKVILVTTSAKQIVIPNTVTDISNIAGSVGVSRIRFESGSSITEITNEFKNCSSLTELILPDSLKTFELSSLSGSRELLSLTIGKNVETITGSASFKDLGIVYNNSSLDVSGFFTTAYVIENADGTRVCKPEHEDFEYFYTDDDYLFYKLNGKYVMSEYIGNDESITLPMNYNGNPYRIYYVNRGKNIIIPNGDITVGERAFSSHSELESLECSEPEIGKYAFNNVYTLKSIKLYNLKSISFEAFHYVDNLESLYIDCDNAVFDSAFYCRNTAIDVTLTGTVKEAYATFYQDKIHEKYLVDSAYIINNILFGTEKNAEYIYAPGVSLVDNNAYARCVNTAKLVTDPYKVSAFTNLETLVLSGAGSNYALTGAPATLSKVIVAEDFDNNYLNQMSKLKNVTYFVEADKDESILTVTNTKWNSGNKVYYGDEWILTQFRDADGKIISMDAVVTNEIIRQPYMESYIDENGIYHKFVGWDVNNDGYADFIPATSVTDIFAQAVFKTHNLSEAEVINPTCTENGRFTQHCADCGECIDDYIIPAIGHQRSEFIKEVTASCSARGYTEYRCNVCGETFKTNYVDKTPCSYGEYVYTVEPTCEKTGLRTRTCTICFSKEQESVPKLPHNYVSTVKREPTCSKEGSITHICSVCKATVTESIPTLPHEYAKRTVSKSWIRILIEKLLNLFFGYEGNNAYYYECVKCRHIMTVEDSKGNTSVQSVACSHKTTSDWTLVQEANREHFGIMVKSCDLCSEYVEAMTFDAAVCDITEFTADIVDNRILSSASVVNVPENSKVFIALYSYSGKLLEVKQAIPDEEGSTEAAFDMSDDAYSIKIMILDENADPECEAKELQVGTAVISDNIEQLG